jgi:DNA polymerase III alpha subunit
VFETYGRNHAALCSTVIRYRAKGALRDVGKALELTEGLIKMLSSQVWGWSEEGVEAKHAEELNLNLEDRRLKLAIVLARELIGTPRHLSQHPGGFVLTHDRLDELVPIERAANARPPGHRMGQGRHRRFEVHEGRLPWPFGPDDGQQAIDYAVSSTRLTTARCTSANDRV